MAASEVRCHVINDRVTVITNDITGEVTRVICPELRLPYKSCARKKQNIGGFFSRVAAIAIDDLAKTNATGCEFTGRRQSHEE